MYNTNELGLLAALLIKRKVPFTFTKCNDGWCITGDDWDVAINCMTLGSKDGLLELLNWEKDRCNDENAALGYLTALNCIDCLQEQGLIPKD